MVDNQTVENNSIWQNKKLGYYIIINYIGYDYESYGDETQKVIITFTNTFDGETFTIEFKKFTELFTKIISSKYL